MLRRGVSAHFLLQQIFPSQGSSPALAGRFFTAEPTREDCTYYQVTDTEGPKGGSHSERMEWRAERDVQKRAECREKTVTLATRVYLGMQRLDR